MARRNLVLGRGDRRGAFRVSLLLCGVGIVSWALGAHNVADWNAQIGLVMRGAGGVVIEAAFVWLVYLAVEPYARRLRPWTLVTWTRFLGGGFSDPVVGRDALVGVAWAVLVFFLSPLRYVLPPIFGQPPPEPAYGYLDALLGPGRCSRRRSAPRARASCMPSACCCSTCCCAPCCSATAWRPPPSW